MFETGEGVSEHEAAQKLQESSIEQRFSLIQEWWPNQVLATTSFGLQAPVMLKLLQEHAPQVPLVFIDTGYLFAETYRYAEELIERFDLTVLSYQAKISPAWQEAVYGQLWSGGESELSKYAEINKIEPMDRALKELNKKVWLSGLRRSQSRTRKARNFVERQSATLKIYPILDWNQDQVEQYFQEYQLPRHPLHKDYLTLGDWHSTKTIAESGGDAESSRFGGTRYECGLHQENPSDDYQI